MTSRSFFREVLAGGVLALLVFITSWPALDIASLVLAPDYLLPLTLIPALMTLWGWLIFSALHDIRRELRRLGQHRGETRSPTQKD